MFMPRIPVPRHFSRLRDVAERSDAELDALVEQAIVDAYDEYEQLASFHVVIEEHLAVPFRTTVLGDEVTVTKIDLLSAAGSSRSVPAGSTARPSASWICHCPPRHRAVPNGSTPTGTGPPDDK
jgi:hypothetical protein